MNSNSVKLGAIADYSDTRISCDQLKPDNYVGTDNLLQNKFGKTFATYVPTTGNTTGYISGDILIGNIRPYLRKIWFANNEGGSSPDVLTLRVKNPAYNSRFVYYALFRDDFFRYMMQGSKGSKMPRGDKDQVLDFPIPDFSETTQNNIAHILELLDKKIELNNQLSQRLESIARTMYDYWFVQFDFPDDHGNPYKSAGGKMVYNKLLKRDVPVDWEVSQMNEFITVTDGTHDSPKAQVDGYPLITSKNLIESGLDFSGANLISEKDYISVNKRSGVATGDILFSMIGTVGIVYKVDEKEINFAIKNVALFKTSQKNKYMNYVYMYLKSVDMKRNLTLRSIGSIQKFIGLNELREIPILTPLSIIDRYEEATNNIFSIISNNKLQNQTLVKLRDFLLPLLMNDQVKIR